MIWQRCWWCHLNRTGTDCHLAKREPRFKSANIKRRKANRYCAFYTEVSISGSIRERRRCLSRYRHAGSSRVTDIQRYASLRAPAIGWLIAQLSTTTNSWQHVQMATTIRCGKCAESLTNKTTLSIWLVQCYHLAITRKTMYGLHSPIKWELIYV